MEPEQSDDEQDQGEEQSFFEEAFELDSLVKRVVDSDGLEAQQIYERYKAIVSQMKHMQLVSRQKTRP